GRADHDHRGRAAGRGAPDRHGAVARLAQGRAAHGGPARAWPRALRECRRTVRALAGAEHRRAAHRGATTPSPTTRHGPARTGGDDPGGRRMRRASLLLALTLLATVLASGTAAARAATPRVFALQAAVVAPQLRQQLDAAGQDEMVRAIVILKSQAD